MTNMTKTTHTSSASVFPEIVGTKEGLILLYKDTKSNHGYAQVIDKPVLSEVHVSSQSNFTARSLTMRQVLEVKRAEPLDITINLKCLQEYYKVYEGEELLKIIDVFKGYSIRDLLQGVRQKVKKREE